MPFALNPLGFVSHETKVGGKVDGTKILNWRSKLMLRV